MSTTEPLPTPPAPMQSGMLSANPAVQSDSRGGTRTPDPAVSYNSREGLAKAKTLFDAINRGEESRTGPDGRDSTATETLPDPAPATWGFLIRSRLFGDRAMCDSCLTTRLPLRAALEAAVEGAPDLFERLTVGAGDVPCIWCARSAAT